MEKMDRCSCVGVSATVAAERGEAGQGGLDDAGLGTRGEMVRVGGGGGQNRTVKRGHGRGGLAG